MKQEITLTYAKAHLSEVLDDIEKGHTIYIKRHRKRVAQIAPLEVTASVRKFGQWKGKVKIKKDFDILPPEILNAFGG